MLSKLTLPRLKQLNDLVRHNPVYSKQAEHQRPQLTSYGAMKKKVIHGFPTTLTHITPIKQKNMPFEKVVGS